MKIKEFFRKVGDVHKSPRFRRLLSGLCASFVVAYAWAMTVIFPIRYITGSAPGALEGLAIASLILAFFWLFSWLVCCICAKVREWKEIFDALRIL